MAKGRELGPNTKAVREICDAHGALAYSDALPYLKEKGKAVYSYYTEEKDGKKAGANRYNVAKSSWKKLNEGTSKKASKATKASKASVTPKQRRQVTKQLSSDFASVFAEVKQRGGIHAIQEEIARLQGLVTTVSEEMQAVA